MDILSKSRIVAAPGFNRWLVPPAALAIHLSIGMAYGFSVFWLPLSRSIGITQSAPEDWRVSTLGWMYTLFFVFLGSSAALFGPWVEREGPRKAGVVAACCWGGGFFLSAFGVYTHQIWLLLIGSGVIGGCGLGLGYISPVSTLIKWFPDRRGMATGLAIMGFGGGAMIGTPLADRLMRLFATPGSVGVWQTFCVMGGLYFTAMMAGAFGYRLPPADWAPGGVKRAASGAGRYVPVAVAWKTRQFWLLWSVLCLNVSAGIGILGMASPMIQEMFKDRVTVSAAAGFAGLLSLFNIVGRIFWASLSDHLGRRETYMVFFVLGIALYASVPIVGAAGALGLFVAIFCVALTMYGGGFAAIPAYLADLFGTQQVGAIHGRLLTAWSTAGVLGPVLVNYIREFQIARGVPAAQAYTVTMYVLASLLVVGFFCNLAVRGVDDALFVESVASGSSTGGGPAVTAPATSGWSLVAIAWLLVALPLSWGVYNTVALALQMAK
ncbi:MAG: OFA family MFS transporter [Vicinamibacterales bacterium]